MTANQPARTRDFDYDLPPGRIAQDPLPDRAASRLLIVRRPGGDVRFEDTWFGTLGKRIPPGDLLVLNTTKVRHARLHGQRASGAPVEILLIHPTGPDTWVAMGKPGTALRPGKTVRLGDGMTVEILDLLPGGHRTVRFHGATAEEVMARLGRVPLPPYITREPNPDDAVRYQTVYADRPGSVAAPTAGLHFTPEILSELRSRGVQVATLDLEVGPGTFKPVETEYAADHTMHPETFEIPEATADLIQTTRSRGGKVWAVGTTVVRALESAAAGGHWTGRQTTRLMILPGYRFLVVDRLLTNFHLPRSTLLMLVCAFAGYELAMEAYQHAIAGDYRFYSYGDAMLIL